MNRFHHSGPAILFIVDKAPSLLIQTAATPAGWVNTLLPFGTCERYPQMATQAIREDVRNDLGGDNVIFKTSHGHKLTLQAELNRWSQSALDGLIAAASGGDGLRQGTHSVVSMATPTDITGNSVGLFVWYPDVANRNEVGYIVPMAVLMEAVPTKVGNRTSSFTVKFESNTGFVMGADLWHSFDYMKFQNNDAGAAAIDTACLAAVKGLGGLAGDNAQQAKGFVPKAAQSTTNTNPAPSTNTVPGSNPSP